MLIQYYIKKLQIILIEICQFFMDFFIKKLLKVYVYSQHNIESLDYTFNSYMYHNFLNFDDSKLIISF